LLFFGTKSRLYSGNSVIKGFLFELDSFSFWGGRIRSWFFGCPIKVIVICKCFCQHLVLAGQESNNHKNLGDRTPRSLQSPHEDVTVTTMMSLQHPTNNKFTLFHSIDRHWIEKYHVLTVLKLVESQAQAMIAGMLPYLQWKFGACNHKKGRLPNGSNQLLGHEQQMLTGTWLKNVLKTPVYLGKHEGILHLSNLWCSVSCQVLVQATFECSGEMSVQGLVCLNRGSLEVVLPLQHLICQHIGIEPSPVDLGEWYPVC